MGYTVQDMFNIIRPLKITRPVFCLNMDVVIALQCYGEFVPMEMCLNNWLALLGKICCGIWYMGCLCMQLMSNVHHMPIVARVRLW